MPAHKRRIRPVIEEIVETPAVVHEEPREEHHHHQHLKVEEQVPEVIETERVVASYDQPPEVETRDPELAAREFLGSAPEVRNEERKSNLKLIFFVVILTALIVGFISGGVYVYVTGVSTAPIVTSTPEPVAENPSTNAPSATPQPQPAPKLDSFKVSVLNGSGIIGAAGKVRDSLAAKGFKVSSTGNAANYNFTNTVIQTKASVPEAGVAALKNALSDYVVEVGEALPASSSFDIIVTAGKN